MIRKFHIQKHRILDILYLYKNSQVQFENKWEYWKEQGEIKEHEKEVGSAYFSSEKWALHTYILQIRLFNLKLPYKY